MPLDEESKNRIDAYVEKAMIEYRQWAKDNPDAAIFFGEWIEKHYIKGTYKYLCRAVVAEGVKIGAK